MHSCRSPRRNPRFALRFGRIASFGMLTVLASAVTTRDAIPHRCLEWRDLLNRCSRGDHQETPQSLISSCSVSDVVQKWKLGTDRGRSAMASSVRLQPCSQIGLPCKYPPPPPSPPAPGDRNNRTQTARAKCTFP